MAGDPRRLWRAGRRVSAALARTAPHRCPPPAGIAGFPAGWFRRRTGYERAPDSCAGSRAAFAQRHRRPGGSICRPRPQPPANDDRRLPRPPRPRRERQRPRDRNTARAAIADRAWHPLRQNRLIDPNVLTVLWGTRRAASVSAPLLDGNELRP